MTIEDNSVHMDEIKNIDESPFRLLSRAEMELLKKLLEPKFPGQQELLKQLESVIGRVIDADGSLQLKLEGAAPQARVEERVPVEGQIEDLDGMIIEILLHVVGGYLDELEIYRRDSEPIQRDLAASDMKVVVSTPQRRLEIMLPSKRRNRDPRDS
jgi:hypothetical protein